jgi:hypothetical protein
MLLRLILWVGPDRTRRLIMLSLYFAAARAYEWARPGTVRILAEPNAQCFALACVLGIGAWIGEPSRPDTES